MKATIEQGAAGSVVKIAQYLTSYADRKKASGTFDANFVAAVCTWQRKHGLTPDGVIGPTTWAKMAEKAPTCSTKKNRTSAATCALQLAIGGLTADGIYGSKTKAAVAAYQAAKGLDADGICGPITWAALLTGELPEPSKFVKPKDFKQYGSPWGKKMYSSVKDKSQTMSNSGCGPTAAANIVATVKDSTVDPWVLAQIAMEKGYRTRSSGTAWGFFKHIADRYGFSKFVQTSSMETMKACLDAGGYVVASMGPGYWTKGGHFITLWKYEGGYIYANDPASASRKKQKENAFKSQRKQFFCFWA